MHHALTERRFPFVFFHMKHSALPTASALFLTAVVLAASLPSTPAFGEGRLDFGATIDLDRYSDAPFDDMKTDLAVSVLTEEGVLRGNDSSPGSGQGPTFNPNRNLNRAEFVQIIMRLTGDTATVNKNCFPDVSPDAWYAEPVCRAKVLGIVRGNARVNVEESLWRFEPNREVQYEEALKMLVQVYAYPIVGDTEGMDWYVPYVEVAEDMSLTIPGLSPGDHITRGEMARLTVAFLAESEGQLDELRDAEDGTTSSSSSSRSSSSSSRTSSMSSSSRSSSSFARDPDTDISVRSDFLLLGQATPVLGAVNVFPSNEDINLERVTVRFTNDSSAIENLRMYESDTGRFLGTASRQSAGVYVVNIPTGTIILPRREDTSIYVRAMLRDVDSGGTGGQTIRIDRITIEGTGESSNDDYAVDSTATFQTFQVTPAAITKISLTGGLTTSLFQSGQNQILGSFDFDAVSTDSRYVPRVTSLVFTVNASAGVTLSNVELTIPGTDTSSPCTVSSNTITCSSIPASIGTIDNSQVIRLVADVDSAGTSNPFLQVSLQEAGTPTSAGAITWTDGTNTYTWISSDTPIVRGIKYE